MNSPDGSKMPPGSAGREITLFRIYIAGDTPDSVRAMANLQSICEEHFPNCHRIEVVDILEEPLRALSEGILVTPTLIKLSPPPERRVVGDLSDRTTILHSLRSLEGAA